MNTHKQPSPDCIKKVNLEKTLWKAISEENQAKSVGGAFPCDSPGRGGTCDISAWDAF